MLQLGHGVVNLELEPVDVSILAVLNSPQRVDRISVRVLDVLVSWYRIVRFATERGGGVLECLCGVVIESIGVLEDTSPTIPFYFIDSRFDGNCRLLFGRGGGERFHISTHESRDVVSERFDFLDLILGFYSEFFELLGVYILDRFHTFLNGSIDDGRKTFSEGIHES